MVGFTKLDEKGNDVAVTNHYAFRHAAHGSLGSLPAFAATLWRRDPPQPVSLTQSFRDNASIGCRRD